MSLTFTVSRKVLRQAIAAVKPATGSSGALPVLSGIRIASTPAGAYVEADNLDLMLRAPLDAVVAGGGDVVINAKRLTTVVTRGMAGETLTIKAGERAEITDGTTTVWLDTLPADQWPKRAPIDGETLALSACDVSALRSVSTAASTDFARPILCSVLLEGGYAVATDSYRLLTASVDATPSRPLLLPLATVRVIPGDGCTLAVGTGEVSWGDEVSGGRSRLSEGEFPHWQKLFDLPKSRHMVTANRAELRAAALRADAVVDSHNSAAPVVMEKTAGGVSLAAEIDGNDLFSEAVGAKMTGPAVTVAVNSRFLAQLLGAFAGETVQIDITDALKPVLFTAGGESFRALLMPVRFERRASRAA